MTRFLLCLWVFAVCNCFSGNLQGAERPNVVIIYTDDQGTFDAHCLGSEDLLTPTQDHLAETGITLSRMHAPSAICSSSRAGLLTGRFPVLAGVPGNVSSHQGHAGMPAEQITLAEQFKAAGYATGHVGKWHLGYTPETMPNGQGFDSSFGHMGGCIDNYSHFFYWNGPNRHDLWRNGTEVWKDGEFFPDLIVAECRRFIDAHAQEPFFLYCAINVPHYPLQGTQKWREHYQHLDAPRRMYAEFVSTMDEKAGEILAHLRTRGLRKNTIVVLQSDHGHSTEERAFFGGGNAGNLRGAKGCLFEGGLRVPSFISWPDKIPQGEVRDQVVFGCDWFPTLCELCEVPLPERQLDGASLKNVLLEDSASPHDELFWQLGGGKKPQLALRRGDWKLLVNPRDTSDKAPLGPEDELFLCNLAEDPGELHNLAQEEPQVLKQLTKRLEEIQQRISEEQGE